jgi:hypothetical protein
MGDRNAFFFEKKNRKTFATLDRPGETTRGPASKSFLLLFFKKEALSSLLCTVREPQRQK